MIQMFTNKKVSAKSDGLQGLVGKNKSSEKCERWLASIIW